MEDARAWCAEVHGAFRRRRRLRRRRLTREHVVLVCSSVAQALHRDRGLSRSSFSSSSPLS
jgi:hypothetical protein